MKFKTQFNSSIESIPSYSTKDKVVRSLRDECDINVIFDKYCATDTLPVVREAKFDSLSYNNALSIVNSVTSDYETLPSKLRKEFGSVESYVEQLTRACSGDDVLKDKLVNLGILKRDIPIVDGPINDGSIIPGTTPNVSDKTLVESTASNVSSAVTTPQG